MTSVMVGIVMTKRSGNNMHLKKKENHRLTNHWKTNHNMTHIKKTR